VSSTFIISDEVAQKHDKDLKVYLPSVLPAPANLLTEVGGPIKGSIRLQMNIVIVSLYSFRIENLALRHFIMFDGLKLRGIAFSKTTSARSGMHQNISW
jgi:hypothetical protein